MINWTELFKLQQQLDDRIIVEKGLDRDNSLEWRVVALLVELGEFANEARWFKMWSNDKEPRRERWTSIQLYEEKHDPLLEEFVDVLHFAIGIGLELGFSSFSEDETVVGFNINDPLLDDSSRLFIIITATVSAIAGELMTGGCLEDSRVFWKGTMLLILEIRKRFGITDEEIERAYKAKHKENNARQDHGY